MNKTRLNFDLKNCDEMEENFISKVRQSLKFEFEVEIQFNLHYIIAY